MVTSSTTFKFEMDSSFSVVPDDGIIGEVPGVAVGKDDQIFIGNRSEVPVQVFDTSGRRIASWDYNDFSRVHSITIAPDGSIFIADDRRHVIRVFDAEGNLVNTIGTPGVMSDTGVGDAKPWVVKRAGPPFNLPTDVAVAPDGSLFVSDGYGNARVHHFDREGTLLHSWGEPGSGPGQFDLPHGVEIDQQGQVLVADRENGRIQVFRQDGTYLKEIGGLQRPCNLCLDADGNLFVAELGESKPRVSIISTDGEIISQIVIDGDVPTNGAHSVALDSSGNLYVGLVYQGTPLPPNPSPAKKFVRV